MNIEILITTNKLNPHIDPTLHIWGWEIPLYLFLGGMTAGILIISGLSNLLNRGKDYPVASRLAIAGPFILSIGMFAIFLDLEHKLYAWRFYTAFRITAPMSWGAWIVLMVYPLNILLIMSNLREFFPLLYGMIGGRKRLIERSIEISERYRKPIALSSVVAGVLLGIYTGILLSAYGARPFWNSAILGPIFLVSGTSTATALVILFSRNNREKHLFTMIDMVLILTELFLIFLLITGLLTSTQQHIKAAKLVLGGSLTSFFWVFIIGIGLSLPAFIESLELRGKKIPATVAPLLVLLGGFLLRLFMVEAGQISGWIGW
jgi:formate-dependent nitrite reductase membrane component NrfD